MASPHHRAQTPAQGDQGAARGQEPCVFARSRLLALLIRLIFVGKPEVFTVLDSDEEPPPAPASAAAPATAAAAPSAAAAAPSSASAASGAGAAAAAVDGDDDAAARVPGLAEWASKSLRKQQRVVPFQPKGRIFASLQNLATKKVCPVFFFSEWIDSHLDLLMLAAHGQSDPGERFV